MIRYVYCKLTGKHYKMGGAGGGMMDGGTDGLAIFIIFAIFVLSC